MAVSTGVALGTGVAMAAGATAAAIRAQQMKTKAKRSYYGGDAAALEEKRKSLATGVDQGNAAFGGGVRGLSVAGGDARGMTARGTQLMDSAGAVTAQPVSRDAMGRLDAHKPGAVAEAQARAVMDANAQANLGAARSGGALGLRNALNANAQAGVRSAQDLAVMRAQEEQQLLGAQVSQENADRAAWQDSQAFAEQQRMSRIAGGAQIAQGGNAQALGAASGIGQLGLTNQGQFLGATDATDSRQLQADMDYDTRRQADQQRRAQNLWNLSGVLTGGAAKALGGVGG